MTSISINGRMIAPTEPPYVIAEVSANHNGSIDRALETIKAAHSAGVSAVKIQTYTPDTMTIDCDKEDFLVSDGLWKGRYLHELYAEAFTPFEWHARLFEYAESLGVTLFSTPFDESAVDLLADLKAPAYKVASFELVDLPLIAYIAKQKKPMLMSTGMASLEEIGEAIETARSRGCNELALFHCISSYPAPIEHSHLKAIEKLRSEFKVEVGLSDHTLGDVASITATALGATLIEKHFTISRADGGVDSTFSLEPEEMARLVRATTESHSALGDGDVMRASVEDGSKVFRRSLYFVADLPKGTTISEEHIRRIRPGHGLAPKHYDEVIGKTLSKAVGFGDPVKWECF